MSAVKGVHPMNLVMGSALTSGLCCGHPQEYQQLHYNMGHKITAIVATGNGLAYSTGRLSYTFGLQARPTCICYHPRSHQACYTAVAREQ